MDSTSGATRRFGPPGLPWRSFRWPRRRSDAVGRGVAPMTEDHAAADLCSPGASDGIPAGSKYPVIRRPVSPRAGCAHAGAGRVGAGSGRLRPQRGRRHADRPRRSRAATRTRCRARLDVGPTGSWTVRLASTLNTTPGPSSGTVPACLSSKWLHAYGLEARTGTLAWTIARLAPILTVWLKSRLRHVLGAGRAQTSPSKRTASPGGSPPRFIVTGAEMSAAAHPDGYDGRRNDLDPPPADPAAERVSWATFHPARTSHRECGRSVDGGAFTTSGGRSR
jgi:hypothetical protein